MTDHAHHTINPTRNGEAIVDEIENSIRADAAGDDYTDEALPALAELDAHGKDHIEFMLRFGEALAKAKAHLSWGLHAMVRGRVKAFAKLVFGASTSVRRSRRPATGTGLGEAN